MAAHINDEMLNKMDAYWRAANYLAAGQLYLLDNPLLKEPLKPEHNKKKIVGHWGTVPGQNLIYVHLNRIIKQYNLDMILLSGPGHGGNFFVANTYLEGTYSEVYPNISEDTEGMKRLFKQFSFPGGIASHVAPETPGSIHEGGELGYSLAHGFGAVLDNPDLIATVVVVARQQVPQSGDGRRCSADPAPERLQDLQPDSAVAHSRRGVAQNARGLRLEAVFRRGR